MQIKIHIDEKYRDICKPVYGSEHAACFDLHAAIPTDMMVMPGSVLIVGTGLTMEIPEGYYGDIRARSGLGIQHGISLANGVGTVDADFRSEVIVGLENRSRSIFTVKPGMRVAQMMIKPIEQVEFKYVSRTKELTETKRGKGGLGSTGMGRVEGGVEGGVGSGIGGYIAIKSVKSCTHCYKPLTRQQHSIDCCMCDCVKDMVGGKEASQ